MIYESFCEFAKEMNVNVLAYDYEGYGKASGVPSEKSFYEDIDAAYAFLVDVLKQQPENIVIYGRSIGSGPSCYLAERLARANIPVGALILQSPLLSAFRVVFNFRFTLPGDIFPNIDRISNIRCPFLVVHGTRDEVKHYRYTAEWNCFLTLPLTLTLRWCPSGTARVSSCSARCSSAPSLSGWSTRATTILRACCATMDTSTSTSGALSTIDIQLCLTLFLLILPLVPTAGLSWTTGCPHIARDPRRRQLPPPSATKYRCRRRPSSQAARTGIPTNQAPCLPQWSNWLGRGQKRRVVALFVTIVLS